MKATHEIYKAVTDARPELSVDGMEYLGEGMWSTAVREVAVEEEPDPADGWKGEEPEAVEAAAMLNEDAFVAIVVYRWLTALPAHGGLMRGADKPGPRYYVDGPEHLGTCADTPLEALAEFYVPGSTV